MRIVPVLALFAAGVLAGPVVAEDKELTGAFKKKANDLDIKIVFKKDKMLQVHGTVGDAGFVMSCKYTQEKDGTLNCEVTDFEKKGDFPVAKEKVTSSASSGSRTNGQRTDLKETTSTKTSARPLRAITKRRMIIADSLGTRASCPRLGRAALGSNISSTDARHGRSRGGQDAALPGNRGTENRLHRALLSFTEPSPFHRHFNRRVWP